MKPDGEPFPRSFSYAVRNISIVFTVHVYAKPVSNSAIFRRTYVPRWRCPPRAQADLIRISSSTYPCCPPPEGSRGLMFHISRLCTTGSAYTAFGCSVFVRYVYKMFRRVAKQIMNEIVVPLGVS